MAFPFRSTNLAGGEFVQPSTLATGLVVPCTPAPFAQQNLFGEWSLSDAIPPYPAGTPAEDQDPDGTRYWLRINDLDRVVKHGWSVRKWEFTAGVLLSFYGSPDQELTFNELFFDTTDVVTPPPNRVIVPGGLYEWENADTAPPGGGTWTTPAALYALDPIDNTSSWLDWGDTEVAEPYVKYHLRISMGRAIYMLNGIFAEAVVEFRGVLGYVDAGEFFQIYAAEPEPDYGVIGMSVTSTTNWRDSLSSVLSQNGEVYVRAEDGTGTSTGNVYAFGTMSGTQGPATAYNPMVCENLVNIYPSVLHAARADI